jgi:hypothetical protein
MSALIQAAIDLAHGFAVGLALGFPFVLLGAWADER